MKVYVVVVSTWTPANGIEINVVGVYKDEDEAYSEKWSHTDVNTKVDLIEKEII